ncbi:MAG: hypothetical protein J7603_03600 [Pseudacidovorax sp.]|nr:hypothetical protein [Pseudacidovorax sp.]
MTKNGWRIKTVCSFLSTCILSTGCSTMITYVPKASDNGQSLRYTQGVGTLSVRDEQQEIFMYPTFRAQGAQDPTFTIGYANNGSDDVNISPENIKAYFRGEQFPIYTYVEKVAEIQSRKQAQQIALAIVGGLAAGAAAYGASRQTYTTNQSGVFRSRSGISSFASTSTTRVYDPAAGIFAGAAVGGATALGVRQLEYTAQAQEQAANSMLQTNTLAPLQMVSGDVIIRGCCEPYVKSNDIIRFEVTARGKTYFFDFLRQKAGR